MCEFCRKYLCPAGCPSYSGRSAEWGRVIYRCHWCHRAIYEYDDYKTEYGKPYCKKCYRKINAAKKRGIQGEK